MRAVRILLWHGYLLGGTGSNVYTRALAREWSNAGHDVTVVCQERQPELYAYPRAVAFDHPLDDALLGRRFARGPRRLQPGRVPEYAPSGNRHRAPAAGRAGAERAG